MIVKGAVHILPIQTSLIQSFKRRGIEGWLGQRLCFSQVLVFCQWEWFLHSYSFMIAWFLLDWLYLWLWWLHSYSHSWRRFDSYIMSGLQRDFPRFTYVPHVVAIVLRLVVSCSESKNSSVVRSDGFYNPTESLHRSPTAHNAHLHLMIYGRAWVV